MCRVLGARHDKCQLIVCHYCRFLIVVLAYLFLGKHSPAILQVWKWNRFLLPYSSCCRLNIYCRVTENIKDIASTDTQGSVSRDPRSENYPMKLQGIHMQDPNLSRLGFLVRNWAMGRWLARFTPQKCPRHHLSSPDGLPGGEEERSPRHPAVTAGGAAGQVR